MVGVAGRSRACITCKKRRVAVTETCDSARPNCGQCSRSNRFCEGYDSYPVFLNQTASGWERRQYMQETKPRSLPSPSGSAEIGATAALPQQLEGLSVVWHEQLVSQFLYLYGVRNSATSSEALPLAFLSLVAQIVNPSSLLRLSLRALAVTRIARQSSDARLLSTGTETYCQALNELQKALYDPQRMYGEDTLIAVKALVIHEGYESTSNNIEAWNAHMSAVTRLIVLRRQHSNHSPIAQAIIEEHRYPAMIQSVASRQRNPMGEVGWRAGQIGSSPFNDYQTLFDIGFDVGALAEDVDLLLAESASPDQATQATVVRETLQGIEARLTDWYEKLELETPGALFYDAQDLVDGSIDDSDPEVPLTFHSPNIAEQLTTFWAIQILSLLVSVNLRSIATPQPGLSDAMPQQPPPEAERFQTLAVLITRSAPYQFVGYAGQYLSLRFLFPLNVALETFSAGASNLTLALGEDDPIVTEAIRYRDWCRRYYARLVGEKGVGYARDLQKEDSKWQQT